MVPFAQAPVINLPLKGEVKILKSPGHDRYAFDIAHVQNGRTYRKGILDYLFGRLSVEDFYAWSQPVFSPFEGQVVAARDRWPDRERLNPIRDSLRVFLSREPLQPDDLRPATGNYVVIEAGPVAALLAHFRSGSVLVSAGETVRAGQQIGEVGNSGRSLAPHLHFQLMDGSDPLTAQIIPFKVRRYERWNGNAWETRENVELIKGERVRQ